MTAQPKHNISLERAADLLKAGQTLFDVYVAGELRIETNEPWDKEVVFDNCIVEYFSGSVTSFQKPVKFTNCQFKKCQFVFTYFLGGLTIQNCSFDNYLDFQAGGHNKTGNRVVISQNDFKGFVNFFDCWYEETVSIIDNKFHKGTNLLGSPHNIPVTFDKEAIIRDNWGQLDLDNEGEE